MREKTNSNVKISDIEVIFGGYEKKTIVGKTILATKKLFTIIEKERPFNNNAVNRVLYHQQCLEEYKAEIENNILST